MFTNLFYDILNLNTHLGVIRMVLKNTDEQVQRLLDISRSYYVDGLSQAEIGKRFQMSRPTVSRYLQSAKDTGIVEIKINDPLNNIGLLSDQIKEKYHLKNAIVSINTNSDEQIIVDSIGVKAAQLLDKIVSDGDTIGISWGKTIEAVSLNLSESHKKNIRIVHLKGSVSSSNLNNFSAEITGRFNTAFHTQSQVLPLPVIFDDPRTKDIVLQDRFISKVFNEGYDADIALFTVGTVRSSAMLFNLGYLSDDEIADLQKNSVGDIMSHFIDADGELANKSLDDRTVAVPLSQLKSKKYSILVAGGEAKFESIKVALECGYANVLVTDLTTAKKLVTA